MNNPRTQWFVEDRFGLFIHWGLYSIPARGEWIRNWEKITDEAYRPYFEAFDPKRFQPASWAAMARRAGQKYAVLTAKHHDGFCLFDSALTDYKATNTPARRDLVREYVEAFRAQGLKVGLYYSLIDWHHPDYPVDRHHPLRDDAEAKKRPIKFDRYLDYLHGQVRELLTHYGPIDIMWFDCSYDDMTGEKWRAKELLAMVRSLQPHLIIDNRLTAGHEDPNRANDSMGDFHSPEQIIPDQGVVDAAGNPVVWEACITLNNHWGYHRDDKAYKTPQQVISMLVECVSKGGNLLLNVGPTAWGEFPQESRQLLTQLGLWMSENSESIHGAGAAAFPKPAWGRYTQKGNILYAHLIEMPISPVPLLGLGGKVRRAWLLRDGSEIKLDLPWNATKDTGNLFMHVPEGHRREEWVGHTVVALELK